MRQNKNIILAIIGITTVMLFISYYIGAYMPASLEYPLNGKTVVIDPGHGGIDPGKVGLYGVDEKFINFEISMKLKEVLELSGAKVIMTREDNEGLYVEKVPNPSWIKSEDMLQRRKIIQQSNCDIMVSIHINSFPDTNVYGPQTFYHEGDEESEKLGKIIQEELLQVSWKESRRVAKPNSSYFILKNHMPSLVIECGFLSNVQEEQKLNDKNYQESIAWAIVKGIMRYFYEK